MDIITGYTGQAHITSDDDAVLQRFLLGQLTQSMSTVTLFNFEYSNLTTTSISVKTDVLFNGRYARAKTPEQFTFEAAERDLYRTDIIAVTYLKTVAGIESMYMEYVQGTPSSTSPGADPDIPFPSIPAESVASFSSAIMCRIRWNGGNATVEPEKMVKTRKISFVNTATANVHNGIEYIFPIHGNTYLAFGKSTDDISVASGSTYQFNATPIYQPLFVFGNITNGSSPYIGNYGCSFTDSRFIIFKFTSNVTTSALKLSYMYFFSTDI